MGGTKNVGVHKLFIIYTRHNKSLPWTWKTGGRRNGFTSFSVLRLCSLCAGENLDRSRILVLQWPRRSSKHLRVSTKSKPCSPSWREASFKNAWTHFMLLKGSIVKKCLIQRWLFMLSMKYENSCIAVARSTRYILKCSLKRTGWLYTFLAIMAGKFDGYFLWKFDFLGRNPCRKYSTNWNHLQFYKRIAIKIFFVGFKILVKTPTKNVYLLLVVGGWLVGGWLVVGWMCFFFCTLRRVDRIPELREVKPRSARKK